MHKTSIEQLAETIAQSGRITQDDVIAFRRAYYDDGAISMSEADMIFQVNGLASQKDMGWSEFMLEAMTDFTVRQVQPYGYVDEAKSAWLIERISADGIVETMVELRLLVNILKTAKSAPDSLVRFTLNQVKLAVTDGAGVIGRGRTLSPGQIGAAETELLRDVLYAAGGDNHIAITRGEAEVLFDLNDVCRDAENDPAWTELFVKGVTNYLMFLTSYNVPDRDEVLRRENWLKQEGGEIFKGFGSVSLGDVGGALIDMLSGKDKAEQASVTARFNAASLTAEAIDAEEAAWLRTRIGRDGVLDNNELALLKYLEAESPKIHESLTAMLETAA